MTSVCFQKLKTMLCKTYPLLDSTQCLHGGHSKKFLKALTRISTVELGDVHI